MAGGCSRPRSCCCLAPAALFATAAAASGVPNAKDPSPTGSPIGLQGLGSRRATTRLQKSAHETHDCSHPWWQAVAAIFGHPWSEEKKEWCCKHKNVGCNASASHTPYDCQADFAKRQEAWSEKKTAWCCSHEKLGCKLPAWSAEPYDCRAGLSSWERGWSEQKKLWCCEFEGQGCEPSTVTTTALPTATSSTALYDCQAGVDEWSKDQREWCCANRHNSCPPPPTTVASTLRTTTTESYDCKTVLRQWSNVKREWCCKHYELGCPTPSSLTTTTPKPYDCTVHQAGSPYDEKAWSNEKKRWCCKHELRGCTACDVACVVQGFPASCRNRIEWLEDHNLKHEDNGCAHAHHAVLAECLSCLGCEIQDACPALAALTRHYDCQAGSEGAWSDEQRDWCCRTFDRGCPPTTTTTTTTTPEPYDCSAGWKDAWSGAKRAWCCKQRGAGCTSCDMACLVDGLSASCRDRIEWLEDHSLGRDKGACERARGIVLGQCPSCLACTVRDACPAVAAAMEPYKDTVPAALDDARPGSAYSGALHTNMREAALYDCRAELWPWSQSKMDQWSQAQRQWCCQRAAQQGHPCRAVSGAEAATLEWVIRSALPEVEGDAFIGYDENLGSLEDMKRWCEDRADCVGFALTPSGLHWYPKKAGTGFDARTVVWNRETWRRGWRWYYIRERSQLGPLEVHEKFEQAKVQSLPGARRGLQVPFTVGCIGLVFTLAMVRAFLGPWHTLMVRGPHGDAHRSHEGCAGVYTVLGPTTSEESAAAESLE